METLYDQIHNIIDNSDQDVAEVIVEESILAYNDGYRQGYIKGFAEGFLYTSGAIAIVSASVVAAPHVRDFWKSRKTKKNPTE